MNDNDNKTNDDEEKRIQNHDRFTIFTPPQPRSRQIKWELESWEAV